MLAEDTTKIEEDKFEVEGPPVKPVSQRMFHAPKLERKHSSGDLHSRLKTRKILGVGETDNGDIHRSKISQLLGHNEHLYVKFPRGYWFWHFIMASTFTFLGLNNVFFPDSGWAVGTSSDGTECGSQLASRYYGATLLALAALLWLFWDSSDKAVVRSLLAATALCFALQAIAMILDEWQQPWTWFFLSLLIRLLLVVPNVYFHRAIGLCGLRIRKSNSFNNLRDAANSTSIWSKAN